MRQNRIKYGVDQETGLVVSRFKEEVAFEVLDFEGMNQKNNFNTEYNLEKDHIFNILPHITVKWTTKIDKEVKNRHREFWGMKKN